MKEIVITGIKSETGNNKITVFGITTSTFEKVQFQTDVIMEKELRELMTTTTPITLNLNP